MVLVHIFRIMGPIPIEREIFSENPRMALIRLPLW
jgi:hypothetical protein